VIAIGRLRWLGHLFRIQELNCSRQLILLKSQAKPKFRWLESVEEDLKKMVWGTDDVNSTVENRGGQF